MTDKLTKAWILLVLLTLKLYSAFLYFKSLTHKWNLYNHVWKAAYKCEIHWRLIKTELSFLGIHVEKEKILANKNLGNAKHNDQMNPLFCEFETIDFTICKKNFQIRLFRKRKIFVLKWSKPEMKAKLTFSLVFFSLKTDFTMKYDSKHCHENDSILNFLTQSKEI